jgi:hypothetical protein
MEVGEAEHLKKSYTAEAKRKKSKFRIQDSKLWISASPAVNWKFNKFSGGDNASNLA